MQNIIPQDDIAQKQCSTCKQYLPATPEFFHHNGKNGLYSQCKVCKRVGDKIRTSPGYQKEIIPDGYKKCSKCKELLPATLNFFPANKEYRYGLSARCKKCISQYHSQYYSEHHIPKRPVWPDGYKQCFTCKKMLPATCDFFHAQREGTRDGFRVECRACRSAYRSQQRRDNREVHRARDRFNYKVKSPEQRRAIWHKRVERERKAEGHYTPTDIRKQRTRQKNLCYYCHRKLTKYHIDHIVPLSRGGTNWPWNIVLACLPCNLKKGKKLLHEWFEGGHLL